MFHWNFVIYFVIIPNIFCQQITANVDVPVPDLQGDFEYIQRLQKCMENLKQGSCSEELESKDPVFFDIRVDAMPDECQLLGTPKSCPEATACTKRSGYYFIKIEQLSNNSFLVACDARTDGGDWTVIQRRQDGAIDFFRPWDNYKNGFGDVEDEFFIGLDKLHALTNYQGPQELLIQMEYSKDLKSIEKIYAKYDSFAIGDASQKYKLKRIGKYSGTAGDSLQVHINAEFSTKDQDNDQKASEHCAQAYMGGWWYNLCHWSNLNGHYKDNGFGRGINWYTYTGHNSSLKAVKMMIRRQRH